ncbi:hypothetical protein ACWGF2_39010 [Streptomyces sp. NPDC054919]
MTQPSSLKLRHEAFDEPADPAPPLAFAVGGQMIWWNDALHWQLAELGFHAIRFDNRDSDRSTRLPQPPRLGRRPLQRERPPYTLEI